MSSRTRVNNSPKVPKSSRKARFETDFKGQNLFSNSSDARSKPFESKLMEGKDRMYEELSTILDFDLVNLFHVIQPEQFRCKCECSLQPLEVDDIKNDREASPQKSTLVNGKCVICRKPINEANVNALAACEIIRWILSNLEGGDMTLSSSDTQIDN